MSREKINKPPCGLCHSTAYYKISADGICFGCLDATRREAKRQARKAGKKYLGAPFKSHFEFSMVLNKAKTSGRLACFLNE
jgi:hypothetical protein